MMMLRWTARRTTITLGVKRRGGGRSYVGLTAVHPWEVGPEKGEEVEKSVKEYGLAVVKGAISEEEGVELKASLLEPAMALLERLPRSGLGIGSAAGFHEVVQRSPGRFDVPGRLDSKCTEPLRRVAEKAFGGEAMELCFCGVVIAEPGSAGQIWHVDSLHETADSPRKANVVNVLVPLSHVTADMGPTELVPGSQMKTNHLVDGANFGPELAYQDARNSPERIGVGSSRGTGTTYRSESWEASDALVFDDRILHRGGANVSDQTRAVAYASYRRHGFEATTHFEATRSVDGFLADVDEMPEKVRREFPGLVARSLKKEDPWVVCDGAGGSQVHSSVIKATTNAMIYAAANVGGSYEASARVGQIMDTARANFAAFFKGASPDEIVFGANATTLNAHIANALFRSLKGGGNVVLTALDHDSNVGLWRRFAKRAGMQVRQIPLTHDKTGLDYDAAVDLIDSNTKFVAVGLASNGLGCVNDVSKITAIARTQSEECLVYVDAVHAAPHLRLDLAQLNHPDFVVCSPYKFFGPHLGVLYGRRKRLANDLVPDKLDASDDRLPCLENCSMSRWETGTQQFENIAGASAAVDYIASLGTRFGGLSSTPPDGVLSLGSTHNDASFSLAQRLDAAFFAIAYQEDRIKDRFLRGAAAIPGLAVLGHDDPDARRDSRTSTFAVHVPGLDHADLVQHLVHKHRVICTSGDHYCGFWKPAFGLSGAARLSFLHYNTLNDVDIALAALEDALPR